MADAFQPGAFQKPGFQTGTAAVGGGAIPAHDLRRPRWLLKFDRSGRILYLSDVGGDVNGIFYFPGVVEVQHSDIKIDLERMTISNPSATVNISPSVLEENFIDVNEIGLAKVSISSWDGKQERLIIQAYMDGFAAGYDGEVSSFRLTEDFTHQTNYPPLVVDTPRFTSAQLQDTGGQYKVYPQVWGDAHDVPSFSVINLGSGNFRNMVAGHAVSPLPAGRALYQDAKNSPYVGYDTNTPDVTNFTRAQGVATAADIVKLLIEKYSSYTVIELDEVRLKELYRHLQKFSAAGYTNSASSLPQFINDRMSREFLFLLWQQEGVLTGVGISPTASIVGTLVFGVNLLQLEGQVPESPRYTHFKVRYNYLTKPNTRWAGKQELGASNNRYLADAEKRWGPKEFGDPIDIPYSAKAIDLGDVYSDATAKIILFQYALLHHRGQEPSYLQFADAADVPIGSMLELIDPARGYNGKPAILIGRKWDTPEFVVHTYRTIEPFEVPTLPLP